MGDRLKGDIVVTVTDSHGNDIKKVGLWSGRWFFFLAGGDIFSPCTVSCNSYASSVHIQPWDGSLLILLSRSYFHISRLFFHFSKTRKISILCWMNCSLRLCTHISEQCQICKCYFLGFIDFYWSVHMHPTANCSIQRQISVSGFFSCGAKKSHSVANLHWILLKNLINVDRDRGKTLLSANQLSDDW